MASSQSFSMIQRRMLDGPDPASPREERRAVEDDGDFRAGLVLVPLLVGMHLGNHVLEEEKRSVIDGREPCAEPAPRNRPSCAPVGQRLSGPFHSTPKGGLGHQVVEAFALEAVPGFAVPEGVAEDDVGGVFVPGSACPEQQIAQDSSL